MLSWNWGTYTSINNLNVMKIFSNEGNCGPFNGVINRFSLDVEKLKPKYKDADLQLTFLKTEVLENVFTESICSKYL